MKKSLVQQVKDFDNSTNTTQTDEALDKLAKKYNPCEITLRNIAQDKHLDNIEAFEYVEMNKSKH